MLSNILTLVCPFLSSCQGIGSVNRMCCLPLGFLVGKKHTNSWLYSSSRLTLLDQICKVYETVNKRQKKERRAKKGELLKSRPGEVLTEGIRGYKTTADVVKNTCDYVC